MRLSLKTFFALSIAASSLWSSDLTLNNTPAQVYFGPKGGCTEGIVSTIGAAKKTIFMQAYSFTSAPIAQALKEAHDRGVSVMAILDRSQKTERYSGMTFLVHAGIPTWIDSAHAIAHNKIMIIDGETVITGSFNFTKAAEEHNAENLLILRNKDLAMLYRQNWEDHLKHSDAAN